MQAPEKGCHGESSRGLAPAGVLVAGQQREADLWGGSGRGEERWRVETIWRVTISSDIMPFIGGPTQTTSSISTTPKFLEYLKTNYLLATGLI